MFDIYAMLRQYPFDLCPPRFRAIIDTQERVQELKRKLSTVKGCKLDPKAMHRAIEKHNVYLKAWVDRRRKCLSVAEVIADGAEKNMRDILVCSL